MKKLMALFAGLFVIIASRANNIQITNVSTVVTGSVVQVEFDISWENSWRTASTGNWDGAWVFLKFKDNDGRWKHLNFTGTNVTMPLGYSWTFPSNNSEPGVGMFIYRSVNGFGNVSLLNVRAGITSLPGTYDIKAFAIEMVYIPQGSFYIGDGWPAAGRYSVGNSTAPFQVTGTTITLGTGATNLKESFDPSATTILTNFPTGYNAYWIMKYELSQAGWVDFLNTLTYDQQITRTGAASLLTAGGVITSSTVINGIIKVVTPGVASSVPAVLACDFDDDQIYNESTDGEWNVMTYLNWADAAAYLDWAGLRPMTEMEYEKSCRGPLSVLAQEYAWGTTTIANYRYTEANAGQANSTISNMSSTEGNALYANTQTTTPTKGYRGGIYATSLSTRVSAGAGYYGCMELTGSMNEYAVTTACAAGRTFSGIHGNGSLTTGGNADEDYWPGINDNSSIATPNTTYNTSYNGVTQQAGIVTKGGSIGLAAGSCAVSQRATPTGTLGVKNWVNGIRGVRDAN